MNNELIELLTGAWVSQDTPSQEHGYLRTLHHMIMGNSRHSMTGSWVTQKTLDHRSTGNSGLSITGKSNPAWVLLSEALYQ